MVKLVKLLIIGGQTGQKHLMTHGQTGQTAAVLTVELP